MKHGITVKRSTALKRKKDTLFTTTSQQRYVSKTFFTFLGYGSEFVVICCRYFNRHTHRLMCSTGNVSGCEQHLFTAVRPKVASDSFLFYNCKRVLMNFVEVLTFNVNERHRVSDVLKRSILALVALLLWPPSSKLISREKVSYRSRMTPSPAFAATSPAWLLQTLIVTDFYMWMPRLCFTPTTSV